MPAETRIEQALNAALNTAATAECPPRLSAAVRYAVFPGGARIRPKLCLAVADACGDDQPRLSDAAAAAIELLHCASLVHDDLPCFDDAELRRGKTSLHRAFDERLAVLAGDALIVLAFATPARVAHCEPSRLAALLQTISRGVGMPRGIVAGQAWECEPCVSLSAYQRAKTGALFAAATTAGAAAAGAPAEPWQTLGERLGEAYQVADDIRDAAASAEEIGKPVGRDVALDRPSAAREFGLEGAGDQLRRLLAGVIDAVPPCPGEERLRTLILAQAQQFLPKSLAHLAAAA